MLQQIDQRLTSFHTEGFALLPSAVDVVEVDALRAEIERVRTSHFSPGMRNLLSRSEYVREFAQSRVPHQIASQILGSQASVVRAIFFDKTPASNWYVTWHQDLAIPVKAQADVVGYGPWSVKEGVLHVQPPASVLEKMVSLRIHLDDSSELNGPIKFLPRSHSSGVLDCESIADWRDNHLATICPAQRGDIICMRPLILHSSSVSQTPDHRRVLHLEYSGATLAHPLEWSEA